MPQISFTPEEFPELEKLTPGERELVLEMAVNGMHPTTAAKTIVARGGKKLDYHKICRRPRVIAVLEKIKTVMPLKQGWDKVRSTQTALQALHDLKEQYVRVRDKYLDEEKVKEKVTTENAERQIQYISLDPKLNEPQRERAKAETYANRDLVIVGLRSEIHKGILFELRKTLKSSEFWKENLDKLEKLITPESVGKGAFNNLNLGKQIIIKELQDLGDEELALVSQESTTEQEKP